MRKHLITGAKFPKNGISIPAYDYGELFKKLADYRGIEKYLIDSRREIERILQDFDDDIIVHRASALLSELNTIAELEVFDEDYRSALYKFQVAYTQFERYFRNRYEQEQQAARKSLTQKGGLNSGRERVKGSNKESLFRYLDGIDKEQLCERGFATYLAGKCERGEIEGVCADSRYIRQLVAEYLRTKRI